MTITQDPHMEALYAARRERFDAILDAHDCGASSFLAPRVGPRPGRDALLRTPLAELLCSGGPSEQLPKIHRWAVVSRTRDHGHFVTNVAVESAIPDFAAVNLNEGWEPLCYYDLDNLAGEEAPPTEGDKVSTGCDTLTVTETDHKDGTPTVGLSDGTWQFAGDVEIVERVSSEDRRLPLRYEVAKVISIVVFNTRPDVPPA